jgi:hypothetical protein
MTFGMIFCIFMGGEIRGFIDLHQSTEGDGEEFTEHKPVRGQVPRRK